MILSSKIRLRPTPAQEQQLWKSSGTARWVYNCVLTRQEENYKLGNKFIPNNDLRKEITQLKKQDDFKWLGEVSNNVAKQAVKDACDAYKRFFKGLADKPKYKSRRKSKPSFYNDNVKLKVKQNKLVLLEKVGWIKTSEHLATDTKYKNPRIVFDCKYWYLTVGIERTIQKPKLTDKVIGIDVGIKDLAVCSNQQVFKNINKTKAVRKIEKRLRRLQRSVSRKYEMNKEGSRFVKTSNTKKIEKQIRYLHRRLKNIRENYIHQATAAIVKTKPCKVVMKDLNISGMMKNRHLSKAIQKQKWYEFIRQMKYKCEENGIEFIQVGRFYPSSKKCSDCGHIKSDLKLSDRIYACDCGLRIDRDLNASLNLARYELTA